jgi:hypothetical protein
MSKHTQGQKVDLDGLPPELLKQLSKRRTGTLADKARNVVDSFEGRIFQLDHLIVGLFRANGVQLGTRQQYYSILDRLIKQKFVVRLPYRQGYQAMVKYEEQSK